MSWRVYTRPTTSANGIAIRWYWCSKLPHGTYESREGFLTRPQCEADAIKHGCRRQDQVDGARISMSRLLAWAPARMSH
jgi:hypothetical protein